MEISPEQLQQFIELYRKEFEIELSPADAQQKAASLIRFYIASIIPFEIPAENDTLSVPDLK